jgi:uncharacterized membrane protein (DUF106 family)
MSKQGSYAPLFIIMALSILIAGFWNQIPYLKSSIDWALNPTAGWLLNWNTTIGMFIVVFIISLISIIAQKYATDQKQLRELRKEQKSMQEELKKVRNDPAKFLELQKKQMASVQQTFSKTMKLSTRAILFTGVPFILLFRWFNDYFVVNPYTFLGFLPWFWFYLIFTLIFTAILRKVLDVV